MKENYFENPQKEIEVFVEDITNITEILKKVKKIIRENQVLESEIDIFVQDDENLNLKIKCLFKEEKIFFYFPAFYDLGEWDKKTLDFKDFLESIDYEAVIYLADAKAFMTKSSLKVNDYTYRHFEYDSLQLFLRNMRYDKFYSFSYSSQNCNLETVKFDRKTLITYFWAFHNFSFIEIKNGKIKKIKIEDPEFVKEFYNFYIYNYSIQDQLKEVIKNYLEKKKIIVNDNLNLEKTLSKDLGLLKLGMALGFPFDGFRFITEGENKLEGILFFGKFAKFIPENVEIKISEEFYLKNNELVLKGKCSLLEFAEICKIAGNYFNNLSFEENYREKFRFEGKGIEIFIENENTEDFLNKNIEDIQKILNEYKLPVRIVGTSGKSILIFFNL